MAVESNPIRRRPVSLGPQTHRIIVGFRATQANAFASNIVTRPNRAPVRVVRARTSDADVAGVAARTHVALAGSRQITASMHVLFLPHTLYGVHVQAALDVLRADPAVSFAEVDERSYPLAGPVPDDPLFLPTPGVASGQWYLLAPNPAAQIEGVLTQDLSATDAQDAWLITTGSSNLVIADVDTGVLFAHPDLLRAYQGGRLLPGYDFVGEDFDPGSGAPLGTYLRANDADGWDPDPSDPGDWISSTDEQQSVFPADSCEIGPSSWHGTRVVGVLGALTDNNNGIAGMTWGNAASAGPWVLPVRALGKCGGYDSDIITGVEWAAGLSVPGNIPDNPYPADIINLSLGGSHTCPKAYITALDEVTQIGVLVVVAAGNGGAPGSLAPVESPASCSAFVPGVIAVGGLRNVGTKVGYSSFGPEVGVSAPAGNCVNNGGNCLRSIDTTVNSGATGPDPAGNTYTNEQNPNLGTSFAAPIVSGIAALMRTVNANLTPAQLVARLESSASAFPPNDPVTPLAVCPSTDPSSGACSCPQPAPGMTTQCGTGMVSALSAVKAALNPIGVIVIPARPLGASAVVDASASVASCGNTIASFVWTANPAALIASGATSAQVTIAPGNIPSGGRRATLTLTLTDSAGNADVETVVFSATTISSSAPAFSGDSSSACPAPLGANPASPAPPTIKPSFSPATVAPEATSMLTLTIGNANGFDLTQSNISLTLPTGLAIPASSNAGTSCVGFSAKLSNTATSISLVNAIVPARGSCSITLTVQAASAGTFALNIAAGALTSGPAGANSASASASLNVNAPSSGGGGGGGGQIAWWDLLLGAGVALLVRGRAGRSRA